MGRQITYTQIGSELGSDNTVRSVGAGDLAPDNSEPGTGLGDGGFVDVCNSLAQIEVGSLTVSHAINTH
jgi:hypothetical protein